MLGSSRYILVEDLNNMVKFGTGEYVCGTHIMYSCDIVYSKLNWNDI